MGKTATTGRALLQGPEEADAGWMGKLISAANKMVLEAAEQKSAAAAASKDLSAGLKSAAASGAKAAVVAGAGTAVTAAMGLVSFGTAGWAGAVAGAVFGFWQLGKFLLRRRAKTSRAQGAGGSQQSRSGGRSSGRGGGGTRL